MANDHAFAAACGVQFYSKVWPLIHALEQMGPERRSRLRSGQDPLSSFTESDAPDPDRQANFSPTPDRMIFVEPTSHHEPLGGLFLPKTIHILPYSALMEALPESDLPAREGAIGALGMMRGMFYTTTGRPGSNLRYGSRLLSFLCLAASVDLERRVFILDNDIKSIRLNPESALFEAEQALEAARDLHRLKMALALRRYQIATFKEENDVER